MPPVHATALTEHAAAPLDSPTTADGRIVAPVLVDVRWLREHLGAVRVLDTRSAREFAAGHLPGARSLPLDALLVDDSSRPALAQLGRAVQRALAALDVAPGDHVVLVDDGDGSGALGATLCELAGMRRVSSVRGSAVDQWRVLGNDVVTGAPAAPAPTDAEVDPWADLPLRTAGIAAFEDLVDAVVDSTARIVDARSQLEHEGIIGAPCCGGRGAIPGSVHLEWTTCFDMFGLPVDPERVRALLAQVGIAVDEPIIVTCHAGHRAAITARVLRASGFRDVRVSPGSWHEWSLRGLVDD